MFDLVLSGGRIVDGTGNPNGSVHDIAGVYELDFDRVLGLDGDAPRFACVAPATDLPGRATDARAVGTQLDDGRAAIVENLPGVTVDSIRPYAGILDTHRELELIELVDVANASDNAAPVLTLATGALLKSGDATDKLAASLAALAVVVLAPAAFASTSTTPTGSTARKSTRTPLVTRPSIARGTIRCRWAVR